MENDFAYSKIWRNDYKQLPQKIVAFDIIIKKSLHHIVLRWLRDSLIKRLFEAWKADNTVLLSKERRVCSLPSRLYERNSNRKKVLCFSQHMFVENSWSHSRNTQRFLNDHAKLIFYEVSMVYQVHRKSLTWCSSSVSSSFSNVQLLVHVLSRMFLSLTLATESDSVSIILLETMTDMTNSFLSEDYL